MCARRATGDKWGIGRKQHLRRRESECGGHTVAAPGHETNVRFEAGAQR